MGKPAATTKDLEAAVADASAFIQGLPFSGSVKIFTSPLVEKEVEGLKGIEMLKASSVHVASPSKASLDKVRGASRKTGDDARVSEADIEVLALALELGLPIITDDYSIQNLALNLGIQFITMREKGIKEEFQWSYRCVGCRRYFDERIDECPICGSKVKSSRKGLTKKSTQQGPDRKN